MNYKLTFFTADMVAVNCFELTHIHRQVSNETPSALSSIEWKKCKRSQTKSEIVFSLAYLQAVFNLNAKKTRVWTYGWKLEVQKIYERQFDIFSEVWVKLWYGPGLHFSQLCWGPGQINYYLLFL